MGTSPWKGIVLGLCLIVGATDPSFATESLVAGIKVSKDSPLPGNDLNIAFTNPVGRDIQYKRSKDDPNPVTPNSIAADGKSATWSKSQLNDTVPNDGTTQRLIFFDSANPLTTIDKANSRWTNEGIIIATPVAALGQPPVIGFQGSLASATFINPESFGIVYSDIELFKDNTLANLNSALFTSPTGTPVTGLPATITLLPGESLTLSFGAVAPLKYELALANVAAANDPQNAFTVGAGSAVPEPSSVLLLSIGLAGLAAYRWRWARVLGQLHDEAVS
jgi:hypothetical protein